MPHTQEGYETHRVEWAKYMQNYRRKQHVKKVQTKEYIKMLESQIEYLQSEIQKLR